MTRTLRRLALVAALAALAPRAAAAQAAEPVPVGDFFYARMQDAATDGDRSLLFTVAPRDGYREPSLAWRCMADGLNVMYAWDKYFIGDGQGGAEVRFRFDGGDPSPMASWDISADHSAAFLPLDSVAGFTRTAAASLEVEMQVRDSDGEVLTDRFPLGALMEGLERLPCVP